MGDIKMSDTTKPEKSSGGEKVTEDNAPSEYKQNTKANVFHKLSEALPFQVNKPLIPLKIAVFCWFGAGAVITPFLALYLKQVGLTLGDLSLIYMILPIAQFMGPTLSGIIADKIGRTKPVLLANLFLCIISATSMLFIPHYNSCGQGLIHCQSNTVDNTSTSVCNIKNNGSIAFHCKFECSSNIKDVCFQNYIPLCDPLSEQDVTHNITWPKDIYNGKKYENCVKELKAENKTSMDDRCSNHLVRACNSTCWQNVNGTKEGATCEAKIGRPQFLIITFALMAAFHTFYSNSYRIIDVTSMCMIKAYNSDFGRQRFWSISGILVFSPLAGYVITAVSPENGPPRYDIIFYFFDTMAVLSMLVIWKLDVKSEPRAKNLLKKILTLIKNPDVTVFFIAVFVIGTSWGFTKLFSNLYLEDELNAPSSLLGLIPAVSSLVGLPFLLSSKWFVSKFGSDNLLIAALLGYPAWCLGYSFLKNPWWALAIEVLAIVNYHLLWVAVVTHSHEVATAGSAATAISIAGGIHFGIGKGSGSAIGGFVMSKYGGKVAYRVMAAVCFGAAIFYTLYLYIRRRFTTKGMDLMNLESGAAMEKEIDQKFTPLILL